MQIQELGGSKGVWLTAQNLGSHVRMNNIKKESMHTPVQVQIGQIVFFLVS